MENLIDRIVSGVISQTITIVEIAFFYAIGTYGFGIDNANGITIFILFGMIFSLKNDISRLYAKDEEDADKTKRE